MATPRRRPPASGSPGPGGACDPPGAGRVRGGPPCCASPPLRQLPLVVRCGPQCVPGVGAVPRGCMHTYVQYSYSTVHPTPPLEASLAAHPPALQPPTHPPQEVACTAPLHAAHQGALAGRGSSRERAEGEGAGPAGGRAPARWGRHAAPSRTVEAQVARLGSHSPPAHHTHFMGLTPSSTK